MSSWFFKILLKGKEVDSSFYNDLISIQVEDNDRFADVFSMQLRSSGLDGDWKYFDDERLQLFNNISIKVGFSNGSYDYLIDGYITNILVQFDPVGQKSIIEIKGMDPTCLMNLEEKVVRWSNVTDSEIAKRIFDSYGFASEIDETSVEHKEDKTIVMQRTTDIKLLKSLASKNGFECFVEKDSKQDKIVGYFRKPVLDTTPQKSLSLFFGEKSNVTKLEIYVDSLRPLSAQSWQVDAFEGSSDLSSTESISMSHLGSKTLSDLIKTKISSLSKPSVSPSRILLDSVTTDTREVQSLNRALFDESSWFVKVIGEVNGPAYESILKAKKLVLLRGAGDLYSGTYYVSKVIHIITTEKYVQRFEAKRNALGLTGKEKFE